MPYSPPRPSKAFVRESLYGMTSPPGVRSTGTTRRLVTPLHPCMAVTGASSHPSSKYLLYWLTPYPSFAITPGGMRASFASGAYTTVSSTAVASSPGSGRSHSSNSPSLCVIKPPFAVSQECSAFLTFRMWSRHPEFTTACDAPESRHATEKPSSIAVLSEDR